MGEVYLAQDVALYRKVAIKFLPENLVADEQARKRLAREAQALAKLDHPNICSIYEVGEEDGRNFIVMQCVEGETLDIRIKRKPLDQRQGNPPGQSRQAARGRRDYPARDLDREGFSAFSSHNLQHPWQSLGIEKKPANCLVNYSRNQRVVMSRVQVWRWSMGPLAIRTRPIEFLRRTRFRLVCRRFLIDHERKSIID